MGADVITIFKNILFSQSLDIDFKAWDQIERRVSRELEFCKGWVAGAPGWCDQCLHVVWNNRLGRLSDETSRFRIVSWQPYQCLYGHVTDHLKETQHLRFFNREKQQSFFWKCLRLTISNLHTSQHRQYLDQVVIHTWIHYFSTSRHQKNTKPLFKIATTFRTLQTLYYHIGHLYPVLFLIRKFSWMDFFCTHGTSIYEKM